MRGLEALQKHGSQSVRGIAHRMYAAYPAKKRVALDTAAVIHSSLAALKHALNVSKKSAQRLLHSQMGRVGTVRSV
jgi:hypothetical protein